MLVVIKCSLKLDHKQGGLKRALCKAAKPVFVSQVVVLNLRVVKTGNASS